MTAIAVRPPTVVGSLGEWGDLSQSSFAIEGGPDTAWAKKYIRVTTRTGCLCLCGINNMVLGSPVLSNHDTSHSLTQHPKSGNVQDEKGEDRRRKRERSSGSRSGSIGPECKKKKSPWAVKIKKRSRSTARVNVP